MEASRARRTVAAGIAAVTLGTAASPATADGTGGGTGGGTAGPAYVVPKADRAMIAQEERLVASLDRQLAAGGGTAAKPLTMAVLRSPGSSRVSMCPPEVRQCVSAGQPVRFALKVVNHREGAGNPCRRGSAGCASATGRKYYTCAAASTRNMTQTLTGVDKGELYYEKALKIDAHGLHGIAHIPAVLNHDFKKQKTRYGVWHAVAPTNATDYLARVVTSVRGKGHAVIENVKTRYLGYFPSNSNLDHYNVVFGYDTSTGRIAVAEEWAPAWTFGLKNPSAATKGIPGLHRDVKIKDAFDAVRHSPNGRVVL